MTAAEAIVKNWQSAPQARFAIAVIENQANCLLLLKRSAGAVLGPGTWAFPAGHLEDKETARDCIVRELAEEIGTDCQYNIVRSLPPIRDIFYGGVYEIHLFHIRWLSGNVTLNHEHTQSNWVSAADFHKYSVMTGTDENIYMLGIWPRTCLNKDILDQALRVRRAADEARPCR
ncbi:MAG: NUDIX domain-containing protein [Gammaproteobacteria bacterium]|nr:NUDIX domain-containing protein [Gammaproteobacteria bacterium]